MSGIFGFWNRDYQPATPDVLDRMASAINHRQHADRRLCCQDAIAVGTQTRWETRPTETPVFSDTIALVIDGRFDNHAELCDRLSIDPYSSAAHITVTAYQRWGRGCLDRLRGDFAFVLWDAQAQHLFCARDHMGVRPLYYALVGSTFVFASDLASLLVFPGINRDLNESMIADYLSPAFGTSPQRDATFYKTIFRLPARHAITITPDAVKVSPYWAFDGNAEHVAQSDREYVDELRALLMDAVRARMDSPVPAAAVSFSGGLDSSSVIALMRETRQPDQRVMALHMTAPIPEGDERPYAQRVVEQGGVDFHEFPSPSPLNDLDAILLREKVPTFMVNYPNALEPYKVARSLGARVLLDGVDGDSVIAYGWHGLTEWFTHDPVRFKAAITASLALAGGGKPGSMALPFAAPALTAQVRAFDAGGLLNSVKLLRNDFHVSTRMLIRQWLFPSFFPAFLELYSALRARRSPVLFLWKRANPALRPDFVHKVGLEARYRARDYQEAHLLTERADHLLRLNSPNLATNFEELDRSAAFSGIDVRHPLSDVRVAQYCLALPPDQKFGDGYTRWSLRRAMADLLPDEVRLRPGKTNFLHSAIHLIRSHDLPVLADIFEHDLPLLSAYVDVTQARQIYQEFIDKPGPVNLRLVVRMAKLARWMRLLDDGRL